VLADLVPGALTRDVALVAGSAGFTGLMAQLSFHIPGTPVAVTGQTFAALLVGAALGPWRAAAGLALYLLAGMGGVPWFAGHGSGVGGRRSATSSASSSPAGWSVGWPSAAATGPCCGRSARCARHAVDSTRSACRAWQANLNVSEIHAVKLGYGRSWPASDQDRRRPPGYCPPLGPDRRLGLPDRRRR